MDYTVVEASIDDVETIVDVTLQSFEDAFNKPFYMEREAAISRWKAYIRKEHHPRDAKDPRIVYVSIINGEIVRFVAGHLTERLGLEGEFQSIYVLPETPGARTRNAISRNACEMVQKVGCDRDLCRSQGRQ